MRRPYLYPAADRPADRQAAERPLPLKQRLIKHYGGYGQRWQSETVFSTIKRNLAEAVAARGYCSPCRELLLLAITHNRMILYAFAGFLQSKLDHFFLGCFTNVKARMAHESCPAGKWPG